MNVDSVKGGYHAVRHSESFEWLTRTGFAAKGIVYAMIGVLALMAAFGNGGETTDPQGAIHRIAGQPFGEFALIIIAVGLFAYSLWRFISAVADTEDAGNDAKGLAKRAAYFSSGIAHSAIGITAMKIVLGEATGGGDATRTWTARLMDAPGGILLVVLVGVVAVVAGLLQVRHGWKEEFRKYLLTSRMSGSAEEWTIRAGKAGYVARGIVFGIVGLFLIMAGVNHDPNQARGIDGALDAVAQQGYGQVLLAIVAAGLAAYGAFCILQAKYRRIAQ